MILVLFHDAAVKAKSADGASSSPSSTSPVDPLALAVWHRQALDCHDTSVHFLLPGSWREHERSVATCLAGLPVIWYGDDLNVSLPESSDGSEIWVISGENTLDIDWSAARSAARRRDCDVLVFDAPDAANGGAYAESVHVDEYGQVLGFRRHYQDAPVPADPWPLSASLLVCGGKHARTVIRHLVAHGWGPDSIGRLTRRCRVRWSEDLFRRPWSYSPARRIDSRRGAAWPKRNAKSASQRINYDYAMMPVHTSQRPAPVDGDTSYTVGVRGRSGGASTSIQDAASDGREAAASESALEGDEFEDRWIGAAEKAWTYRLAKRSMDILFSAAVLVILAPLLLVMVCLVRLTSRGPALFGHVRQGYRGREFRCLKFRTMIQGADAMQSRLRAENEVDGPQFKITKDPRLTPLGRWMQRYNIDEIPQFINVLRGEMSLVGPRPSPDKENQFCPGWRRARLSVRPGITGLWQVLRLRNRPEGDFQEWIYYDLEYARHCSFWLDWQILLCTPVAMFSSQRVSHFACRLALRGICEYSAWVSQNDSSPPRSNSDDTGK